MISKLRSWEHLEERKCLVCNKFYVTKLWVCQRGALKGYWIIGSCYCSTKCSKKGRELLENA
jgi:hypothetical protein